MRAIDKAVSSFQHLLYDILSCITSNVYEDRLLVIHG
jgi:hypothetical protein